MKGSFTQLILLLLLCPFVLTAQEATPCIVNVSGGSASIGYYRFEWSVGEMCLVDSYTQPVLILENGLLHAGIEKPIATTPVDFFATGDIMIFPNPVYTTTEVNFTLSLPGRVSMRLLDIMGRLIEIRQFDYNGAGHIEKFDLQRDPAGTYMLHLLLTPTDQNMPTRKGNYKLIHITH